MPLDTGQRRPYRLRLDDPDGALIDIEEVVGATVAERHDHLAYGNASTGEEVEIGAALQEPTGLGQLPVNQDTGALHRRQLRLAHP